MAEVKMYKAQQIRALLEVDLSKKCTRLWREAHVEVKLETFEAVQRTFGRSNVVFVAGARHSVPWKK